MSNKSKKWRDELITVKVPKLAHEVFNILQARYGEKRMGDAVMKFLEEHDDGIVSEAEKVLQMRDDIESVYRGESKDSQ